MRGELHADAKWRVAFHGCCNLCGLLVSKKATEGLSSDDFASSKRMVGSGPYKFVNFLLDDRVEMGVVQMGLISAECQEACPTLIDRRHQRKSPAGAGPASALNRSLLATRETDSREADAEEGECGGFGDWRRPGDVNRS